MAERDRMEKDRGGLRILLAALHDPHFEHLKMLFLRMPSEIPVGTLFHHQIGPAAISIGRNSASVQVIRLFRRASSLQVPRLECAPEATARP